MNARALESAPAVEPAGARRTLLSTKLYPPRVRPGLVARPWLLDLLKGTENRRLTVVCAPAGYGKSTLVAQWLALTGVPVAWASLDSGENDAWSFFDLVVAALRLIDHGLVAGTEALLEEAGTVAAPEIAESLAAELSATTRHFVLVLDDYHVIETPSIHETMAFLLHRLPPTVHVVIASRAELPLPLAALRASGEVLEVGQADLRFASDEALQLYHESFGLALTPGEVDALTAHTEGWVAALYLVGISMRGQPREHLRRYVEETSHNVGILDVYLWEEILQRQPEDLRTFLLRTSILDRFNADLCAEVAGVGDASELIRRCERDGLFVIPLDDHGTWYRYHHLFAEALRERLAQIVSAGELGLLHLRAAEWLEEHGFEEDAFRHATAGRDWDRAVRLLERVGAPHFERDHPSLLRSLLERLPSQVLEGSPRLAFWLAWTLARSGDFPRALPLLRIAEATWTVADDRPNLGLVRMFYSLQHLMSGDSRRAIDEAQEALDRLPDDRPGERSLASTVLGLALSDIGAAEDAERSLAGASMVSDGRVRPWNQLIEMVNAGGMLVQRGKLSDASVLFRRVITTGDRLRSFPVQHALCHLGHVYIEWNLLEEAERTLLDAEQLVHTTRAIIFGNPVCLGLARLAWARGQTEEAFDEVESALSYAHQTGLVRLSRNARAQQAHFWLASGQLGLARRWADGCGLDPSLPPERGRQREYLTIVRLLILEGRPDLALRLLATIQDLAETDGRHGEVVELLVLRALAHVSGGDNPSAVDALDRALVLGEPGGYVRVFVGEGKAVAPLLRRATVSGTHRGYATRLLAAIDRSPATARPDQTRNLGTLSDREVEVLRLVAAGLANREIGQRLFISEKTVKTHLSNILGKLGAANRSQAVDRARYLDLL